MSKKLKLYVNEYTKILKLPHTKVEESISDILNLVISTLDKANKNT